MLNNIKIGTRLLAGFGILIVIFGGLLLFSIDRMWSLSELTGKMHRHPFAVSKAVLRVNANIIKIHRTMKDVALAGNPEELKKDVNIVDLLEIEVYKDFDIIVERFLGNKEMFEQPLRHFRDWKPVRDEVISLMFAGQIQEAAAITRGKGALHVEKLEKQMDELIDFARKKAEDFLENAESTRDNALIFIYSLLVVATISMVIFALMLTRSIMRPITVLKNATIEIGKGNLAAEIGVISKDEIGDLAREFDEMRLKLKESYRDLEGRVMEKTTALFNTVAKLQELNLDLNKTQNAILNLVEDLEDSKAKLEIEIDEHEKAEVELAKHRDNLEVMVQERTIELEVSNRYLEDAVKELETFSYSISHDLKAPLRAISGYSGMLHEEYSGSLDEEGNRLLGVINDNAIQMGQLIEDILQYSRVVRRPLERGAVHIKKLTEGVILELEGACKDRDIEINVQEMPHCNGDSVMIKQVLMNLISNAIKYTGNKEKAEIEVGSRQVENETVYYVKDNGVGFDMKYADRLFGLFQRLHSTKEFEGTGVGLAIVQKLIHKHRGKIWAEAKPNEGATFNFKL